MEIKVSAITSWDDAKKAALYTIGKTTVVNSADEEWISGMLRAEHSPIRERIYRIEVLGIPYWVANHLRTHHIGVNCYISTSREDRTHGKDRSELRQDAEVNMMLTLNAQSLINISRKRLCNLASKETREVWQEVRDKIREIDPTMARFMLKDCQYRGGCHEVYPCGWQA